MLILAVRFWLFVAMGRGEINILGNKNSVTLYMDGPIDPIFMDFKKPSRGKTLLNVDALLGLSKLIDIKLLKYTIEF